MSTAVNSGQEDAARRQAQAALFAMLYKVDEDQGHLRARRALAMQNIQQLRVLREELDQALAENVAVARLAGSRYHNYGAPSWADIGAALGVSKQAAQARFTPKN